MNVRSIFASAAVCGLTLASWCATAHAGGPIFGYGNGMTYRAEAPWDAGWRHHGYAYGFGAGNCGRGGAYMPNRLGRGAANGYGSPAVDDYYAPANGTKPLPNGAKPKLEPTPAPPAPVPDEREAMPRLNSPIRAAKYEAARK